MYIKIKREVRHFIRWNMQKQKFNSNLINSGEYLISCLKASELCYEHLFMKIGDESDGWPEKLIILGCSNLYFEISRLEFN